MTRLTLIVFVLALVANVVVSKNCICLSQPDCLCTELNNEFPTCDLCTACGPILDACTNVINAGNVGQVGTGSTEPTLNINNQERNCVVIDGVTVNGNINGGGDDCIRVINGGVLNGDASGNWGSDCIEVIGQGSSITGRVRGDSQEDCVRVNGGHIGEAKLGSGRDCLVAIDATIGSSTTNVAVDGESQVDCFIISNTIIDGTVTGSSDNDCIEVTSSSQIDGDLDGSNGDDIVFLQESEVTGDVNGFNGNDIVAVLDSVVNGDVDGFNGDDEMTVTGSSIGGDVTGFNGADEIIVCDNSIGGSFDAGWGTDVCASDLDAAALTRCESKLECYSFDPKP